MADEPVAGGMPVFTFVPPVTIATPCTGVCTLDETDTCDGCHRTLAEIAAWATMTNAQRRTIMATLVARRG